MCSSDLAARMEERPMNTDTDMSNTMPMTPEKPSANLFFNGTLENRISSPPDHRCGGVLEGDRLR